MSGTFKAEAKDEATAKNLRDVMAGFLAMAKMQAGNKPGMQQLADSLVISGEGNTVALAFTIPTEVIDVLEGLAKGRKPAAFSSNRFGSRQPPASAEGRVARRAVQSHRPFSCTIRGVGDHVFFYGTLMSPFNRPGRQRITPKLTYTRARHHEGRAV